MSFIQKKLAKIFQLDKKKFFVCIAMFITLIIIIGAGVWFYKLKVQSLTYAITRVNKAIQKDDFELLNKYVDFGLLSESFVHEIKKYWPEVLLNEKSKKELENTIQKNIITTFGNDQKSKEVKSNTSKDTPSKFDFFPSNFIAQVKEKKITVYRESEDIAILSVPIKHEEAGYSIDLRLLAQKIDTHWLITKVVNGRELIQAHVNAVDQRNKKVESDWRLYTSDLRSQIDQYYHVTECKIFFAPQSNKSKEFILTISVSGINMSKSSVRSVSMQCFLYDSDGKLLLSIPLNSSKPLYPGNPFSQEWFFEITENKPEFFPITKASSITGKIELLNVRLTDGKVFNITTSPDLWQVYP